MATGGYARRHAPGSDIDAVLLHPHKASADEVKAVVGRLWYPIWDAR
jgi:UTP:GlnB (protein PII) uridylyltransferase